MRTRSRALAGTMALLTGAVLVLATSPGSSAADPGGSAQSDAQRTTPGGVPGEQQKSKVKDNRSGRVDPTARQRERAAGLRARWNALGTPAVLASAGTPLATGLPADAGGGRPGLRRRQPGRARPDRGRGRRPRGAHRGPDRRRRRRHHAAALRRPAGRGRRPDLRRHPRRRRLARQLIAGPRRRGARHRPPSARPTPSASPVPRPACRTPTIMRTELVAVPTADRGARAAYKVTFGANLSGADPIAFSTYVDARDGVVLVREDLVDSDADNPEWEVFPNVPPTDYSSTDTRGAGASCRAAAATRSSARSASPLAWDVDPATGITRRPRRATTPSPCTTGSATTRSRSAPSPATPRPDRDYAYPWTNQWLTRRLQPGRRSPRRSATTSTPPGPTCSRCTTACTTGPTTSASPRRPATCRTTTSAAAASATTPSRATPRPAGSAAARPPSPPATTPTRSPPRRARADHQHVPVAADRGLLLRPVRRRRLRHDGDRPRVHPRHHQPHDRRPERRAQLAAGHERELVGPAGDGVPQRARLRAARHAGVHHRPVRHRRPGRRHPQLQHEQQPAQLQQRRLRLRRPAGPRLRRGVERDQLRHPRRR